MDRDFWIDFYKTHQKNLQDNYPGLSLPRFLLEIQDIENKQVSQIEEKILSGIPFAYLIGELEFYGQKFQVTPDVLIPRQETEYLMDIIIKSGKKFSYGCDVGVGSGVILLTLLKNNIIQKGFGIDISLEALNIAQKNAQRLSLCAEWLLNDRLKNVQHQFDLIISNPPYIKAREHFDLVHKKVHEFEPHVSLYLRDQEYESWFHEFFIQVKNHLNPSGLFVMEGHELELQKQKEDLEKLGFVDVKVIKDLSGSDRFLFANKK